MPGKPLSSFMMYSQSVRAEVKKSSGAGSKDIASLIGEQWRNLSDAEKAKWTKAAKDSKESYVAEHGEPEKKAKASKGKGKAAEADGPKIKKPTSAYLYFTADNRADFKAKNPDASFGDTAKGISEMWKKLTDAQKKPYEEKAAKDKKRYEAAKNA